MVVGGLIGRFLGWLISNSLDESILKGGQVGRRIGSTLGFLAGLGLGSFAAIQATAFVARMLVHL
jgi:hypothetical protein